MLSGLPLNCEHPTNKRESEIFYHFFSMIRSAYEEIYGLSVLI